MAIYKILFTPMEDFFFGDEGTFTDNINDSKYFLKSNDFPSQTTIFGIIRYLGLKHVKSNFSYSTDEKFDNEIEVGRSAFNISKAVNGLSDNRYGKINGISSVFIHRYKSGISNIFIKIPSDNKYDIKNEEYISIFNCEDIKKLKTGYGYKWFPSEFDTKKDISLGYVSIDNGLNNDGKEENNFKNENTIILKNIF